MSSQTISVGVVGSGGMAKHRAERFERLECYRVQAIASRNTETGNALADKHAATYFEDWHQLIEQPDLDAVVICTHNDSHGEIAVAALQAGKHVFTEYPLSRFPEQGARAVQIAKDTGRVLRLTHSENVSPMHVRLRELVAAHGPLCATMFTRLTPGRGARPEVLFNLAISGPPALFFIYHVYPMVDLFGPVEWVEGGGQYEGLEPNQSYDRFVNAMTVKFRNGGLGQWLWAGGIQIQEAEEIRRYILMDGTLIQEHGAWHFSSRSGGSLPTQVAFGRGSTGPIYN